MVCGTVGWFRSKSARPDSVHPMWRIYLKFILPKLNVIGAIKVT